MNTTQFRTRAGHAQHSHDDAPDTSADFEELAVMPDGHDKQQVQDEVVTAWLPMARRLARKYRNRGEDTEDLEQVAAVALVKAVERFEPDRGKAFESYAVPTISGELKRHFRDNLWDLHVPRRVQNLRNQVRNGVRTLNTTQDSQSPTVPELAAHTGLSEEDVKAGIEALGSFSSLSLDVEMPGSNGESDGFTLASTLGTEETGYDHIVDREAVRASLGHLSDRERRILYLRFFQEMTQAAIGRELGLSQMHISRLITCACRRIREEVDSDRHEELPAAA